MLIKSLKDGTRYLLRLDTQAKITTNAGGTTSRVAGELMFVVCGDHDICKGVRLERIALVGKSVKLLDGETGSFSVLGTNGTGTLDKQAQTQRLTLSAAPRVNYERLDRALVKDIDRGHGYEPAFEIATAGVTAEFIEKEKLFALANLAVNILLPLEGRREIRNIVIRFSDAPLFLITVVGTCARSGSTAETILPAGIKVIPRELRIQPVGFSQVAGDADPSGTSHASQLTRAISIFSKACVKITSKPMLTLFRPDLKYSSSPTDIRGSHDDPDPMVITVFYVRDPLTANAGENAGGFGVVSEPILAEPNGPNSMLLAHALGHVLNLRHPGNTPDNADAGTVMESTVDALTARPDALTYRMCDAMDNPRLATIAGDCCLAHDVGDHYIRDFPTDTGSQPSTAGPGENQYSMSNVWNRLSNHQGPPPGPSAPAHEQPIRFELDGTTIRQNYLFAQVEKRANFPITDAKVRFYLKTPGSGGGGGNLLQIGEASVDTSAAGLDIVGEKQLATLQWTVPVGAPSHSCIFAVVYSQQEPPGDPQNLDWTTFEQLVHWDNDWVQRNLAIANIMQMRKVMIESAPFVISVPSHATKKELPLKLTFGARGTLKIATATVQIGVDESINVKVGTSMQLLPKTLISVAQALPVIVKLELPNEPTIGDYLEVTIDPTVDNKMLAGFACRFQIDDEKIVLRRIVDETISAFVDSLTLTNLRLARPLLKRVRALVSEPGLLVAEFAQAIVEMDSDLKVAELEAQSDPRARRFNVGQSIQAVRMLAVNFQSDSKLAAPLVQEFRHFAARLGMVAASWPRSPFPL